MEEEKSLYQSKWKNIYMLGGFSALLIITIIPVQLVVYFLNPPPQDAIGYIDLFQRNWLLGLLSLDLLYIVNNTLLILLYLGLYYSIHTTERAFSLVAVVVGLIGIASYYSSTVAFEMLSLSDQYQLTSDTDKKTQILAAGEALLTRFTGTSFDIYYVLNAVTLIIFSLIIIKSDTYSKATGFWGLISGILMIIPSTAGLLGLIFSITSLIPWTVFSLLVGVRLIKLSKLSDKKLT